MTDIDDHVDFDGDKDNDSNFQKCCSTPRRSQQQSTPRQLDGADDSDDDDEFWTNTMSRGGRDDNGDATQKSQRHQ
jgi:hypothetical protein